MNGTTIISLEARDIRFPTSRSLDGSDAMHTDPDYSAAYVVLRTDADVGIEGHGLTFTIGRGKEVVRRSDRARWRRSCGRDVEEHHRRLRGFWRRLTSDSQLRWLGPEKGVIHLATAALVNAVWDLWAKLEGKPLWKLLVDLSPEEFVACVDFRYITDALDARTRRSTSCATRGAGAPRARRSRRVGLSRRTRPPRAGSATRRQGRGARPRGGGGGLHPRQDEGRRATSMSDDRRAG